MESKGQRQSVLALTGLALAGYKLSAGCRLQEEQRPLIIMTKVVSLSPCLVDH